MSDDREQVRRFLREVQAWGLLSLRTVWTPAGSRFRGLLAPWMPLSGLLVPADRNDPAIPGVGLMAKKRRGMKTCILCFSDGNGNDYGMDGPPDPDFEEEVRVVAKYYLPREGSNRYGWMPVCRNDAEMVKRVGFTVEWFPGEAPPEETEELGEFKHDWDKWSLVTEEDGTDRWGCKKCGKEFRRKFGEECPEMGCTVESGVNFI